MMQIKVFTLSAAIVAGATLTKQAAPHEQYGTLRHSLMTDTMEKLKLI
jgi:hypothetical protein